LENSSNIYIFCGWIKCFDNKYKLTVKKLRSIHSKSKIITVVNYNQNDETNVFDEIQSVISWFSLYRFFKNHRKNKIYVFHRRFLSRFELMVYLLSILPGMPDIVYFPRGSTAFEVPSEKDKFRKTAIRSLVRKVSINSKILMVYIFFLPLLLLRKRQKSGAIKKILFVRLDRFGDMVLTLPALVALRKRYPEAEISVLCSRRGYGLLKSQNAACDSRLFDEIILWDSVWDIHGGVILGFKHLIVLFRKVIELRHKSYDVIIHPVAQGAWLLLTLLLKGKRNIAIIDRSLFLPRLLQPFVTDPCFLNEREILHYYQHSRMCVEKLGVCCVNRDVLSVNLDNISSEIMDINLTHKLVVNVSAGDPVRQLPIETTARLIEKVLSQYIYIDILLVGTENDSTFAANLCKLVPTRVLNFVGKTSIDELIYIFKNAPIVVTSDTGSMHLAAMTDIHVVAYFTAGSLKHFSPVTANCTIIQHELGCSGCGDMCFTDEMPKPCMAAITADELFDAVSNVLDAR